MTTPQPLPPLDSTLGAILVGGVVSTYLFGIATLQVYYYFRKYSDDSLWLKWMVAVVWMIELGHTIFSWHAIYTVAVTFYCQPQHIKSPPHSLEVTILFACLMYVIVVGFFANRVRIFSGRWLVTIICWVLTAVRVTSNLAMMGIEWVNEEVDTLQVKYRWLMAISLSLGVAVDIVIAFSMCYWLWQIRGSKFEQTRKIVDTLLMWSVETGIATTVASAVFLILFLDRNDLAWFPFYVVQVKLYSNSLLVSLNGRRRLRSSADVIDLASGSGNIGRTITDRDRGMGMVFEMSSSVTHRDTHRDTTISKDMDRSRGLETN
ncbi:hypothetical protein C8R47DRAFT_1127677 [Mycena vitilis]|nr:hypothetical protein C8R47DRAFT_1127677 [Mycena vitilis]